MESDIEFGRRAGAKTILIAADSAAPAPRTRPDLVARNLLEAARAVTSHGW
ncbi:MAG: HAD hydrolase-like protein [Steroidobacteraceae bacterium]